MKIRITKAPLTKYQSKGQVDENSAWIRSLLEYEKKQGASGGVPHSTWGWNNPRGFVKGKDDLYRDTQGNLYNNDGKWNKPTSIEEAEQMFRKEYLPDFVKYPLGIRERMADFAYNSGEDGRIYELDQYLRKYKNIMGGLDQRTTYRKGQPNAANFDKVYSQYQKEIDALPMEEQVNLLDQGRNYFYRNLDQVDGSPNPNYESTWKGRLDIYPKFKAPTTQAPATSQTAVTKAAAAVKPTIPALPVTDPIMLQPGANKQPNYNWTNFNESSNYKTSSQNNNQNSSNVKINMPMPQFDPNKMPGSNEAPAEYFMPASPITEPSILPLKQNNQPNYNWTKIVQQPVPKMPGNQSFPKLDMSRFMPKNILTDADMPAEQRPQEMSSGPSIAQTPGQQAMNNGIGPDPFKNDPAGRQIQKSYDSDPAFAKQYDEGIGAAMIKGLKPFDSRKEMRGYVDFYNKKNNTDYKLPFMTPDRTRLANQISGWGDALSAVSNTVDYYKNNKKAREWQNYYRQNKFDETSSGEFEGNYTTNTGTFQPNKLPIPVEGMFAEGGVFSNDNIMKIRIIGGPKQMAYGGQSGYGLDLGQKNVYENMHNDQYDSISNTMSGVPREMANIEAEGGETVYGDIDGDGGLEHMKITGPRHSNGGVPLDVPEGSFIFSDTKKMKIKDPKVLASFGMTYKNGGITPAQIAKKYDINKYKAIMESPNADSISKGTAQLMAKNYQSKLGFLATIQESMKGFPQGLPKVAEGMMGASQGLTEAAYGGYHLPTFQGSTGASTVGAKAPRPQIKLGDWTDDYEQLQSLLLDPKNAPLKKELFNRYKSSRGAKDNITEEQYVKNLLEAQRQIYTLQDRYKDKPGTLSEKGWDKNGINTRYAKEAKAAGLTPLSEADIARFQSAYQDMADLVEDDRFKENFGQYFQINPRGKADQTYKGKPISGSDNWWGNTTNQQYLQLRGAQPIVAKPASYYKCADRSEAGTPSFETKTFNTPEEAAAAGFTSSQSEAARLCGMDEIPPGKMTPGQTGQRPFKMLFPDKLNMLASAAVPPQMYMPYSPDLNYRQGNYALPDWLAKAQQLQQSYNIGADTMGTYGPASALATNMSFLAGQTGNAVTQAQDQTGQQAIGIFNDYTNRELAREDKVDLYNTMNAKDRYDNTVKAKQAYDNSKRTYINNLAKGYSNAWNNRMKLDLLNTVNPIYNINPDSGRSYFMNGYGPESFGLAKGNQTMSSDNLRKFTQAKNKYKAADMSDKLAEENAMREIFGAQAGTAAPGLGQMLEAGFQFNPTAI